MSAVKWILMVVLLIIIVIAVWWVLQPKTILEIEMTGGFAYITPQPSATDNHVDVAYLNSWKYTEDIDPATAGDEVICDVHQIGTELKIVTGTIVGFDPPTFVIPASREFDMDKAVVTFSALEAITQNVSLNRSNGWPPTPTEPANPGNDPDWENLKWVPSLTEYFSTQTPPHTLDPNWPSLVNGRMRLRGGVLKAAYPTNSRFRKDRLNFKKNGVSNKIRKQPSDEARHQAGQRHRGVDVEGQA
jgi:hypothetical protein